MPVLMSSLRSAAYPTVARFLLSTLLFVLRREQGRLAEVEGPMRAVVDRFAAVPGPRAWLALLLVECGRADEARHEVDRLAREGLASFAGTEGWRASLGMLAEAVVALGDTANAAGLYAELLPVERYCLVLGDGVLCLGPAARPLGALAALLERWDEAETHFARALIESGQGPAVGGAHASRLRPRPPAAGPPRGPHARAAAPVRRQRCRGAGHGAGRCGGARPCGPRRLTALADHSPEVPGFSALWKSKLRFLGSANGGADGTRTRNFRRDRPVL